MKYSDISKERDVVEKVLNHNEGWDEFIKIKKFIVDLLAANAELEAELKRFKEVLEAYAEPLCTEKVMQLLQKITEERNKQCTEQKR